MKDIKRRLRSIRAIGISKANPHALRDVSIQDADLLDKVDIIQSVPVTEWIALDVDRDVITIGPVVKIMNASDELKNVLKQLGIHVY